jgi:pyruvate formate lyase activating enzyme
VKPFTSPDIIHEIGTMIKGADQYILQQCSRNVTVLDPVFIEDENRFLTDAEMDELRDIAAMYVRNCTIR